MWGGASSPLTETSLESNQLILGQTHSARSREQVLLPSTVSFTEPEVISLQWLGSQCSVPSTESPLINFVGDSLS